MKNLIYVFFWSFLLWGCSPDKERVESLQITQERIKISIEATELNSYQEYATYQDSTNELVAYNPARHSLDFFDLEKQLAVKSSSLEEEGPNGIGKVRSIYWHNSDSLFLFERGKLHIVQESGEKVDSFDLYMLYGDLGIGEPICNFYFKLIFNPSFNQVYFFQSPLTFEPEATVKLPLVSSLNLGTKEIKMLPIYHSDHFQELDGQVGFIASMGFGGFLNQDMIYNFQYESSLYSYSITTQEISASKIHENKEIPFVQKSDNPEIYNRHAIENVHFLASVSDPWENLIYRLSWGKPNKEDSSVSFLDKSLKVAVFDKELNFIQDFDLPDYTYQVNNWFVNENGLHLNVAHPNSLDFEEGFLVFDVFKFRDH